MTTDEAAHAGDDKVGLGDSDGLLRAILTCVTAGPGLGFNRGVLFLVDDARQQLVAAMALGATTPDEANETWATLAQEQCSLSDLVHRPQPENPDGLQALLSGLTIPLTPPGSGTASDNPLLAAYWGRRVVRAHGAALSHAPPRLREVFVGTELACVPLLAKDRALGLIVADNAFTREPISDDRIRLLQVLALLAGLALDNARTFAEVNRQAEQLRATLDELQHTQERLLHSERLATVGAVVARVSHEIRNPLTTIGGFARGLAQHPDDRARVVRNAGIIADEVTKLEILLKEMLDFTSPKAPTLRPTDLSCLLESFVDRHRGELAGRGITLALDLADGLPPVSVDGDQLQRVLLNLWRNAIDAIDEAHGEEGGAITLGTCREPTGVTVVIGDTGQGMSPQVRAQVFTPFFTTKTPGTGLGLAVVKKIIDDHHARLNIESEYGSGTTMRMTFPCEE